MILLNGVEVKFGQFPNKETNLPIGELDIQLENEVKWVYEDDSDFLKLTLLKGWIATMGGTASLYITYMPHSRMDRPNGHYVMSLSVACDLINNLGFSPVTIREPHSPRTTEWVCGAQSDEWCVKRLPMISLKTGACSIFFPDFGARERYQNAVNLMPTAYGKKKRDFASGDILDLEVSGEVGTSVLIVDDLCSRGGTFVAAAKELKKLGAERINLLVAYVEDNVFTGEIFDHIDRIYTSKERELRNHPRIIKID